MSLRGLPVKKALYTSLVAHVTLRAMAKLNGLSVSRLDSTTTSQLTNSVSLSGLLVLVLVLALSDTVAVTLSLSVLTATVSAVSVSVSLSDSVSLRLGPYLSLSA